MSSPRLSKLADEWQRKAEQFSRVDLGVAAGVLEGCAAQLREALAADEAAEKRRRLMAKKGRVR